MPRGCEPRRARPRRAALLAAASAAAVALLAPRPADGGHSLHLAFCNGALRSDRPLRLETVSRRVFWSKSKSKKQKSAYANLARLEDVILESCDVEDIDKQRDCMKTYENLLHMHFKSQQECDLESMRCVVLDVIDRMTAGIADKGGLKVLTHFRQTVDAFERNHGSRGDAFDRARGDKDEIDKASFNAALRRAGLSLPDMTVDRLFMGADANHDGKIDESEFNDFMLAGVFAAEPLKLLEPPDASYSQKTARMVSWVTAGVPGRTPQPVM